MLSAGISRSHHSRKKLCLLLQRWLENWRRKKDRTEASTLDMIGSDGVAMGTGTILKDVHILGCMSQLRKYPASPSRLEVLESWRYITYASVAYLGSIVHEAE